MREWSSGQRDDALWCCYILEHPFTYPNESSIYFLKIHCPGLDTRNRYERVVQSMKLPVELRQKSVLGVWGWCEEQ